MRGLSRVQWVYLTRPGDQATVSLSSRLNGFFKSVSASRNIVPIAYVRRKRKKNGEAIRGHGASQCSLCTAVRRYGLARPSYPTAGAEDDQASIQRGSDNAASS